MGGCTVGDVYLPCAGALLPRRSAHGSVFLPDNECNNPFPRTHSNAPRNFTSVSCFQHQLTLSMPDENQTMCPVALKGLTPTLTVPRSRHPYQQR
ncbi:hypothetical protein FKM82_027850 [Ascaphus truei]